MINPVPFKVVKAVSSHLQEEMELQRFFGSRLKEGGFFVDVGANRPENAVSAEFKKLGWDGVVVEPIPENAKALREAGWKNVFQCALTSPEKIANGFGDLVLAGHDQSFQHSSLNKDLIDPTSFNNETRCIKVPLMTLNEVLSEIAAPECIQLLSIDTEGTGLDVLNGLLLDKYCIFLILIEDWQRDSSVHRFLVKHGYKFIQRTGFNSWYVPQDTAVDLGVLQRLILLKKVYISSWIKRLRFFLNRLNTKKRD